MISCHWQINGPVPKEFLEKSLFSKFALTRVEKNMHRSSKRSLPRVCTVPCLTLKKIGKARYFSCVFISKLTARTIHKLVDG